MKNYVVIPVVNWDLAIPLLDSINLNSRVPTKVLIIDNSESTADFRHEFDNKGRYGFDIVYLNFGLNIGVNKPWNIALQMFQGKGHISFLNDDLVLGPTFFDEINDVLYNYPDAGCVCPQTFQVDDVDGPKNLTYEIGLMRRREGWAFTMASSVNYWMPLIPDDLKIFCGDDWFWWWVYKCSLKWVKTTRTWVTHYGGRSCRALGASKVFLKADKDRYRKHIRKVSNQCDLSTYTRDPHTFHTIITEEMVSTSSSINSSTAEYVKK